MRIPSRAYCASSIFECSHESATFAGAKVPGDVDGVPVIIDIADYSGAVIQQQPVFEHSTKTPIGPRPVKAGLRDCSSVSCWRTTGGSVKGTLSALNFS